MGILILELIQIYNCIIKLMEINNYNIGDVSDNDMLE